MKKSTTNQKTKTEDVSEDHMKISPKYEWLSLLMIPVKIIKTKSMSLNLTSWPSRYDRNSTEIWPTIKKHSWVVYFNFALMWIVDIICTRSIAFFPVFLSVSGFYRFNRWYWIGLDFLWKTASLKTSLIVPNIFWTAFRSPIPSPSSSSGGCDISVVSSSDLIFITSLITWPTKFSTWCNSPPVKMLDALVSGLKKFFGVFLKGNRAGCAIVVSIVINKGHCCGYKQFITYSLLSNPQRNAS